MDSIPLALCPLVKRLEKHDVPRDDLISIIFIVRLIDLLHSSFYGTFLSLSLADELTSALSVSELKLEIDVFTCRWSYEEGTVSVNHRMSFDYDCHAISRLTKVARGVLNGTIGPREGLSLIKEFQDGKDFRQVEVWYRDMPGRMLVIPLMSLTCSAVYFGGTAYDLGFSALDGLVAGCFAWGATVEPMLFGIMDIMVSFSVSMLSVMATVVRPDDTCFTSQVLGTLYWFLYGTSFVISLYEIMNNQLITGVTRFGQATLRSYGLAFGVLFGIWATASTSSERTEIVLRNCNEAEGVLDDLWMIMLFPLSAIACLMQFRVALRHWIQCLIVQTTAYGLQYLLGTHLKQPDFIANLVPTYATVLMSHAVIYIAHRMMVSDLEVSKAKANARQKKDDNNERELFMNDKSDADQKLEEDDRPPEEETTNESIKFLDAGWVKNDAPGGDMGYVRSNRAEYERSDHFFCLLPALYLLVPGSGLLRGAFFEIISSIDGSIAFASMGSSLFQIALGQVIGLKLGFATIWAVTDGWPKLWRRCRK